MLTLDFCLFLALLVSRIPVIKQVDELTASRGKIAAVFLRILANVLSGAEHNHLWASRAFDTLLNVILHSLVTLLLTRLFLLSLDRQPLPRQFKHQFVLHRLGRLAGNQ